MALRSFESVSQISAVSLAVRVRIAVKSSTADLGSEGPTARVMVGAYITNPTYSAQSERHVTETLALILPQAKIARVLTQRRSERMIHGAEYS